MQQQFFPQSIYISLKEVFTARTVFLTQSTTIYSNLREVFTATSSFFPQSIYMTLKEVLLQGQFPHSIYGNLWQSSRGFLLQQAVCPSINLQRSKRGFTATTVFLTQSTAIYGNPKEVFYCNKQFFP